MSLTTYPIAPIIYAQVSYRGTNVLNIVKSTHDESHPYGLRNLDQLALVCYCNRSVSKLSCLYESELARTLGAALHECGAFLEKGTRDLCELLWAHQQKDFTASQKTGLTLI